MGLRDEHARSWPRTGARRAVAGPPATLHVCRRPARPLSPPCGASSWSRGVAPTAPAATRPPIVSRIRGDAEADPCEQWRWSLWSSLILLAPADLWLFRRHVRRQELGEHRLSYYRQLLLELWIPTVAVLGWMLAFGVSPRTIGLGWLRLETVLLSRSLSLAVVALAVVLIVYGVCDLLRLRRSSSYRASVNEKLRSAAVPSYVGAIMPATPSQRRLYGVVAVSAGVCEEILYRGFVVYVLATGVPALGIWGSVLVSSALFALGHLYQGPSGMIRTFVIGLILCLIYLSSGTLLLGMLIHTLIDAVGAVLHPSDAARPGIIGPASSAAR